MILKGNQRGGGKDMAIHLMKPENEIVQIHEMRGFMSSDLMGAFNEIYAISRGTKCSKYLYSLSVSPPPYEEASDAMMLEAIERSEKRLGLDNQPRAIVFHEKNGRRHAHCVWSRIDVEKMKAIQISHDHPRLMDLSRSLFLERGWDLPKGFIKRGDRDPRNFTHGEWQQAQRIGKNPRDIKADFQSAWEQSDSKEAFEHALLEKGYMLARGDTGRYVAVDQHGEIYSVAKQCGIKTKDVRARLGNSDLLPSIEEVRKHLQPDIEQAKKDLKTKEALELVCRHDSAFTQKMMVRTLKPLIPDDDKRARLIADVLASQEIVEIGKHRGQTVYTRQETVEMERCMMRSAQYMAERSTHAMNTRNVDRAIDNLNHKISTDTNCKGCLSMQQIDTIRHMTQSNQLSLVVGVAGAGKTTIMAGAKEALESQGYRVRGAAPSGIAASGLQDVGMDASTIHALEYRLKFAQKMMDENEGRPLSVKQRDYLNKTLLTSKDVLIVDEAGMVSSKQMANLVKLTEQSGAKLILVGDHEQLQSVEAGAAFRTLLERNQATTLTEVRRQKTDWQREATTLLSEGHTAEALSLYQQQDCIQWEENRTHAKEQLVQDVMAARNTEPDKSRLVLAYTRKDVADLNRMIKTEMIRQGAVTGKNVDVTIHTKDQGHDRKETQGFAMGDRILFRENNRDLGVMNGTFGTLNDIDNGTFHVTLDNGNNIAFSPKEYNRFQLGYAATVHKSQGVTVDESYVLATPHFDRHTSYVAMSRHKHNVKLYANGEDFKSPKHLKSSLGKEGKKFSTLDFTDPMKSKRRSWKDRIGKLWDGLRKAEPNKQPEPQTPETKQWIDLPEQQCLQQRDQTLGAAKSQPKPLKQQDMVAMRDQFLKEQKAKRQPAPTQQHTPDRGPTLER